MGHKVLYPVSNKFSFLHCASPRYPWGERLKQVMKDVKKARVWSWHILQLDAVANWLDISRGMLATMDPASMKENQICILKTIKAHIRVNTASTSLPSSVSRASKSGTALMFGAMAVWYAKLVKGVRVMKYWAERHSKEREPGEGCQQ